MQCKFCLVIHLVKTMAISARHNVQHPIKVKSLAVSALMLWCHNYIFLILRTKTRHQLLKQNSQI